MSFQISESSLIEFAKTIELAATRFLEGQHRSPRGARGVEFHSALPYSEGEDAKFIDWKRFAKSDRYYVNRFSQEERTGWTLLIDSSASMSYGKKSLWAHYWAAAVIFLAKAWGDSWRLLPDIELSVEEAFSRLAEQKAGYSEITKFRPQTRFSEDRLIVLSDFFYSEADLTSALERWQSEFSHVHLIQVLDPRESAFEFERVIEFKDLESPSKLVLDSNRIKDLYLSELKTLQRFIDSKRDSDENTFTIVTSEGESLEKQLLHFFEGL